MGAGERACIFAHARVWRGTPGRAPRFRGGHFSQQSTMLRAPCSHGDLEYVSHKTCDVRVCRTCGQATCPECEEVVFKGAENSEKRALHYVHFHKTSRCLTVHFHKTSHGLTAAVMDRYQWRVTKCWLRACGGGQSHLLTVVTLSNTLSSAFAKRRESC